MNRNRERRAVAIIIRISLVVAILGFFSLHAWQKGWIEKARVEGAAIVKDVIQNMNFMGRVRHESPETDVKPGDIGGQKSAAVPGKKAVEVIDQAQKLNDQAVDLIMKKKYWEGMYLLQQAIVLDSSRVEPHVNMAVALKEVGLTKPAIRYFEEAERIDSSFSVLLRNYAIILGEGKLSQPQRNMESDSAKSLDYKELYDSRDISRLWGLDVQE